MGIKNLTQFLKKYEVYETLNVSTLRYTKIGVDTPMFLYKFKSLYPDSNEWLGCFITFISFLRRWDIHPIFIFEGKAPPEKAQSQENRRESKQKIVDKTNAIQVDLDLYKKNGCATPLLSEVWTKLKAKGSSKSLLLKKTISKTFINIEEIQDEIDRRRKYEFCITPPDIEMVKELFSVMGVSYIQSKGEAEADCVSLFYNGYIDYILSEDTDVLACVSPSNEMSDLKVITNFNTNELTFTQVSKHKVLHALNLTHQSFRDFCIMCGTDYNKNIFRIGVEKSYKLVSQYYNIESIPLDTSILNHLKVRELFTVQDKHYLKDRVVWCKYPSDDFVDVLARFAFDNGIKNIDVNHVFEALSESMIELNIE